MNLILKTSLKNIFGKPFRTLLVLFSIFVCSVCGMVCFDFVSGLRELLGGSALGISKADFLFLANDYWVKGFPDGFPEHDVLEININSEMLYKDIETEYNYVTTDKLSIYGVDVEEAVKMDFIEPIELGLKETVITGKFAAKYGYSVGDKLVVHDRSDNEIELVIAGISSNENKNYFISNNTAIVNLETSDIISCGKKDTGLILVNILDNEEAPRGIQMIRDYYPSATVINFMVDESMEETLNQMLMFFYLIFAVAFLLVIFVTASICNRIVSERMPFIGTLRSLGMSSARTGRILLLENILYAILGSVPAVVLYGIVRVPLLDAIGGVSREGSSFKTTVPPMSPFVVAGVIIGAAVIECIIPLKAILKALKTSIRDIIFDNRDTAYRFSMPGLIAGLVFAAGAIVSAFFCREITAVIICLVCSVTSLALLFPWILKGVTALIRKLADKRERAGWSLAAAEAISRKSTVGSGVLCVTAAAMSVIVFSFIQSALLTFGELDFHSDVILSCNDKMTAYMFVDDLKGVTETETVYTFAQSIRLNDVVQEEPDYIEFFALPEGGKFKYYSAFNDLPETIEDGSIFIDDDYASKHGISTGDTVKITYSPTSVLPIVREYKVSYIFGTDPINGQRGFFLSERDYKEIFRDRPGYLLIMCEDPDYVANMIRTYAVGSYDEVMTYDEMVQENAESEAKLKAALISVVIVAVGMTFIGMVSNQLIGFEGRKKECAVLLSTAMGRTKLSGILFREMLITAFTASSLGTAVGVILVAVINFSTSNNELIEMDVETNPVLTLLFFVFLVAAFTGTVLFPIRHLGKMKIAEQIKYE